MLAVAARVLPVPEAPAKVFQDAWVTVYQGDDFVDLYCEVDGRRLSPGDRIDTEYGSWVYEGDPSRFVYRAARKAPRDYYDSLWLETARA